MTEYLNKAAVLSKLCDLPKDSIGAPCNVGLYYARSQINALPVADVRPVVRGKWIRYRNFSSHYCSECMKDALIDFDTQTELLSRFCPYCGADMRGE